VLPYLTDWDGTQHGRFIVQDVYQGMGDLPRGTIRRIRVIAVPPKVQPQMNSPMLGVSAEDPGKFVLGTAPVEADGSAHFWVPSGVPVLFQALDGDGLAVRTMRSLTYVQPHQTLACIGCHESRDSTPLASAAPLAALRQPSRLKLGPEGSWPLRFDTLVQPVLDAKCVSCHRPDAEDAAAARFDLTGRVAYQNLLAYGGDDLKKLAFERSQSDVGDCPARQSKLLALLREGNGHEGVKLTADEWDRLITWMDTYAQRQGSFSEQQEDDLRRLRDEWADLLGGE
jgi:cytochrome c553